VVTVKVAVAQVASPPDEPVVQRIERVADVVREAAAGSDLVVLPELWTPGYFAFDRYEDRAEPLDGPLLTRLRRWAAETGTHLHVGSVLERGDGDRLHNTAVLLGPSGEVELAYRKVHVFGYESLESTLLTPGERADVARTSLAAVGTSTCYDLRFPELYRQLVDRGAELIVVPAAWPAARLEHWRLFTRARAVENQVFLVACNAGGTQGEVVLGGHSVVVDPWGRVLGEAGTGEEILRVEIDLAEVARIRQEFPVLDDRRVPISD
jgi:predicted amidohydrolase